MRGAFLHEYEIAILNLLKKQRNADLDYLQGNLGIGKDSVVWAIENLSKAGMVKVDKENTKELRLSAEGKKYLKQFPEEELVLAVQKSGGSAHLSGIKNEIGLIWAKRNGWITIDKGQITLTEKGVSISQGKNVYNYRELLNIADQGKDHKLTDQESAIIGELKKRNLLEIIERGNIKNVEITEKGASSSLPKDEGIGALTREIIVNKSWQKEKMRGYDINASSEEIYPARLHPMHEFIDIIRASWFNMGFTEVSGPIIESAFWNFDALFSPQDHPTRDMQDTFFLKNPNKIDIEDIELMNRVKKMHKQNWTETWKESLAEQALLRTHTTSVSARYINKFANNMQHSFPVKLFSVGKVFRNESIDYKHLAELHQIDGIIIGNNLTLSNLISTLTQFYSQLGIDNITIKPSYFPFVEPGLEVNYYDKNKKDTIELCGGGIIRKEITKAMGTDKTVLAWGGGLERLMFNFLELNSLTELYKNDLGWLRKRAELKL
jgi:phenylalanyl-tRNA synthetase alpha chain